MGVMEPYSMNNHIIMNGSGLLVLQSSQVFDLEYDCYTDIYIYWNSHTSAVLVESC